MTILMFKNQKHVKKNTREMKMRSSTGGLRVNMSRNGWDHRILQANQGRIGNITFLKLKLLIH